MRKNAKITNPQIGHVVTGNLKIISDSRFVTLFLRVLNIDSISADVAK